MTPPPPEATAARRARDESLHLGLGLGVIALVVVLFHFTGNFTNVASETHSLFIWIWRYWQGAGEDMQHAWLMPLVSLGVVWWQRRELRDAPKRICWGGLALLLAGVLLHVVAIRAQQPRFSLIALVVVIWAIPLYLYGWAVARRLLFPCGYLLLCFTSYFLVMTTFRLRLMASATATVLLNGLGIEAQRVGSAIYSSAGGGFNLDVADACSGLRSLVVMTAIAAPYAYFMQTTMLRKWLLFVLSVPMAALANVLRIVTVAIVAHVAGRESAMRVYHDYSGYLVFVIAILLLMATANALTSDWRKGLRRWITPDVRHS